MGRRGEREHQPVLTDVSPRQHTEEEALEDSVWAERARKAAQHGFLGRKQTEEFIKRVLRRKTAR